MTLAKDWYKSKLIWLGIVASLYNIITLLGVELPAQFDLEHANAFVNAAFGLLAIVFRWGADQPIAQSSKGVALMASNNLHNRRPL